MQDFIVSNWNRMKKQGKKEKRKNLIITINTRMWKILYDSWTEWVCIFGMFVITECKSGILCDRLGRGLTRKRRRGGKRRKTGREQKLEGHVRLLGIPSNIVCESPSVEFRLIKCSTLFVAFVLLAAILSLEPFLLKSVLFVAAGSRKLSTLSRPRRVFPAFSFHPPLHQSWCVFPPDFPRFRDVFFGNK